MRLCSENAILWLSSYYYYACCVYSGDFAQTPELPAAPFRCMPGAHGFRSVAML